MMYVCGRLFSIDVFFLLMNDALIAGKKQGIIIANGSFLIGSCLLELTELEPWLC
jgi:hypothetical protein